MQEKPTITETTNRHAEMVCPMGHIAIQKQLWEKNGDIYLTLKELVNPVAEQVAQNVTTALRVLGRPTIQPIEPIAPGIPYGSELNVDPYRLPPYIFDRNADVAPILPATDEERDLLVENFLKKRAEMIRQTPFSSYVNDYGQRMELTELLKALTANNAVIDPEKWKTYMAAVDRQLVAGNYTIESAIQHSDLSIKRMLKSPHRGALAQSNLVARLEEYSYRSNPLRTRIRENRAIPNALMGMLRFPVGAYGRGFTEALFDVTEYMLEKTTWSTTKERATTAASGHEQIIETHMARGEKKNSNSPDQALIETVQEGIVSITQTLTILTAERVDGYDDPKKLVEEIVSKDLIQQFTRAIPMGLNGPFSIAGLYFPGLVRRGQCGLELNADILAALREVRKAEMPSITAWTAFHAATSIGKEIAAPVKLGLFCPAADNAIGLLSKAFATVLHATH